MSRRILTLFTLCVCRLLLADHDAPAHTNQEANSGTQLLSPEGTALLRKQIAALAIPATSENAGNGAREVLAFYSDRGDSLAWFLGNRSTAQARQMIEELKHADEKGLRPGDYDGSLWDDRLALVAGPSPAEADQIRFDVALTAEAMRFLAHLHHGRVNPVDLHFALASDPQTFDGSEFLRNGILPAKDVHATVLSVEPQFLAYRRTLDALHTYLELTKKGDGPRVPRTIEGLRAGDSHSAVPALRRRLQLLGDLGRSQGDDSLLYDPDLASAVTRFQSRHGLEPSSRLDRRTLDQLNTPLAHRVLQLQLTLERWRWLPHTFTVPPVVVNIPEFRLYAIREDHRVALDMNVVAGRAYQHHETPVFTSSLRSVVFRPYWNVPLTIQRNELLPEIDAHPSYLDDNAFEIVDARDHVPVNAEDTPERDRKLRSGEWLLRQKPGPHNSLGLVKFELPNPYEIYLHGTPAQELFAKPRRDFSHGCIRVEDPVALAVWVFRDNPEWNEDRIRTAMNSDATLRVNLKEPIPVWILYGTAVVREDGQVHFLEDIYGHDAALEQALAKQQNSTAH